MLKNKRNFGLISGIAFAFIGMVLRLGARRFASQDFDGGAGTQVYGHIERLYIDFGLVFLVFGLLIILIALHHWMSE